METDASPQPPLPTSPASRPAFACGPRMFTVDDILEAARCLGEWEPFRAAWLERRAAASAAQAAGLAPESDAIEAAAESYRYARDLVSGEECERWLEARGLTFEDLTGYFERRLQAELAEAKGPRVPTSEDERLLRTDALLADEFSGWARQLARRVALAAEAGRLPAPGTSIAASWADLEAAFAAASTAVVTPESRRRALVTRRLALKRVTVALAEFDSQDAAREAVVCAREDGTALEEIAATNGFPCRKRETFLGDLPAEWIDLLTSARLGEVLLPPAGEGGIVALSVLTRQEPSLDDEAICRRIDAGLLERYFCELESRHIRWIISVEIAS